MESTLNILMKFMKHVFSIVTQINLKAILLVLFPLSISFDAIAQTKLPFSSFPPSFEVAEYKGKKGCVPNNAKFITFVATNLGARFKGRQESMQSPKVGKYNESIFFNKVTRTAYIMSNIKDGKLCLVDIVTDISIGASGTFTQVNYDGAITKQQCEQIPYSYEGACGNFNQISNALIAKGFNLLWQGKDMEGNIKTWMSGNGETYVLTTNYSNNATVFTALSTASEYHFLDKNWIKPK